MKTTGRCPKCDSTDVVKIPGLRTTRSGRQIQVGFSGMARLDRYMCAGCGYTEAYVDPKHIRKVKDHFG